MARPKTSHPIDYMSVYNSFKKNSVSILERKYEKTGIETFDLALSGGKGIPLGGYVEVSSDSGVGKTTLMLEVSRHFCEIGKRVLYIDVETGVSDDLMMKMGLDGYYADGLFMYLGATTFNAVGQILDAAIYDDDLALIVIDSLTMLVPDELVEEGRLVSEGAVGLHARYTGNLLMRYRGRMTKSEKTVVFINQLRNNIAMGYGVTRKEPAGGLAQAYAQDVRVVIKRLEDIKDGTRKIGSKIQFSTIKNRLGDGFIPYETLLYFGKGIDETLAFQKWLLDNAVIEQKGGGNYVMIWEGKEIKIRGVDNLTSWLSEHLDAIKAFVNEHGGLAPLPEGSDEE